MNPNLTRREFLRNTTLTAGGLALAKLPGLAAATVTEVPSGRLERLNTGANVCRWFRFPRSESPEHFTGYIPQAEAEMMAKMGLKHVRICVGPKVIMDAATGEVVRNGHSFWRRRSSDSKARACW